MAVGGGDGAGVAGVVAASPIAFVNGNWGRGSSAFAELSGGEGFLAKPCGPLLVVDRGLVKLGIRWR